MVNMQRQMAQRLEDKRRLYEQFGTPLEEGHKGEYVAISHEGQTILGAESGDVLKQGLATFGRGNFGVFRGGHRAFAQWLLAG